ncbi:glycoside hydrolase family 38 N-terminal domain-containing protein [Pseudolactococcus reticulitermitis]|uniref:Alpha-mannosidase n=1 Tax=Pseudolactococcus reticulitermitis TaxID=2025039 RepID=A0A224X9N9_9LACT|nr:glycoside hydrolase family 38 C-terminal domain-containing protein [Lactococcus reticulitermitis]GAX46894.1 alpha-mannosidase [Lactococcus reticulitermitis]
MKKKVHVIHHTHWDLEWYFTSNESFVQLSYHLDEVMTALENNEISYYLLDGQMSLLDEYLQSFPEQKARIKKLVQSQKLWIGPWYTQTDELIVSGESIIRNLTLGMALAEDLGSYMNIGYLPDSFGQSKDMPKIYKGLGIDRTVFWRGLPKEKTGDREFYWQAEDGSKVLTSNIKDGYFVGVGLIYSDQAQDLMSQIEDGAVGQNLVLPVGGDQRYVDFNLRDRIDFYNQQLSDYELKESNYDDLFSELEKEDLDTIEGEFISGSVSKIHRSIYSSRYDHKYLNDKLERRMIYQVEPLLLMAEKLGIANKQGLVDRIWKLLAKNHAHDSAGGCNSDKTNRVIRERFVEADQLSYSIVDYLTRKISESQEKVCHNQLSLFNTLPLEVTKTVKVQVSTEFENIQLRDSENKVVAFDLIKRVKEYSGEIRREESEKDPNKYYYIHELAMEVTIPSLSLVNYQVSENKNVVEVIAIDQQDYIENDNYQLSFIAGQIQLLDKKTKKIYHNILSFEDGGDEGDTYDYSPAHDDRVFDLTLDDSQIRTFCGEQYQEMLLTGFWKLPKDLNARAEGECNQKQAYELKVTLKKGSQQVECHLVIDNKVMDHRMRAVINLPFENRYSYTDTPFGTVRREVEDSHLKDWQEIGWREEPTSIYPMLKWVNAHDSNNSWTIFAKGIKEYQLTGEEYRQLSLTLFRSVGFLGRPDLLRRPGVASGNAFKYIPTPDSQLLEKLTFKFAINLEHDYNPAQIGKAYLDYALSLPFYQNQGLNLFTTTLKYFVSNTLKEEISIPENINLKAPELVFSSLRKNKLYGGWDLRVYNPSFEVVKGENVILSPRDLFYEFVDLKGIALTERQKNGKIDLGDFRAGQIKTVHFID